MTRPLKPSEIARQDQHLARAREAAQDPGTAVIATEFAPIGMDCSWCECPVDVHEPGDECPGCPEPARVIIWIMYSTPEEQGMPACAEHYPVMMTAVTSCITVPITETVSRILD